MVAGGPPVAAPVSVAPAATGSTSNNRPGVASPREHPGVRDGLALLEFGSGISELNQARKGDAARRGLGMAGRPLAAFLALSDTAKGVDSLSKGNTKQAFAAFVDASVGVGVAAVSKAGPQGAGAALLLGGAFSMVGGGQGVANGFESFIWMNDRGSGALPAQVVDLGFIR